MNRTCNPWVSLVALLLGAVLLVLCCSGCAAVEAVEAALAAEPAPTEPARFVTEYIQSERDGMGEDGNSIQIITDTDTGAQYLVYIDTYHSGYAGGRGVGITALQPTQVAGQITRTTDQNEKE